MLNVALLSKWHVHATDYARQAAKHPELQIAAVWDDDVRRGEEWAKELGVPFFSDLPTLLRDPKIDAVIVNAPTNRHREVILAAVEQGKHVFTEKVLALTAVDCDAIFSAVEEAGVQLMVSLPRLTDSTYLYAQNALDKGWIGKLTMIRSRLAHHGAVPSTEQPNGWLPEHFFDFEACGGGSFVDLGAHPIYLTRRLAGKVEAVTARFGSIQGRGVDDQAVAIIEYASGAMGTVETGFVSEGSPFQLELYGTEGTLLIEDQHVRLKSRHFQNDEWTVPSQLPEALPLPMEQWVAAIKREAVPTILKEDIRTLTLINEAAARSHREERRVTLREIEGGLTT